MGELVEETKLATFPGNTIEEELKTASGPEQRADDKQLLIKPGDGSSEDWVDANDRAGVQRVASLEQKSHAVTDKLLELQLKHKEISDRVQNVLLETVDLTLGGDPELKEYLRKSGKIATELEGELTPGKDSRSKKSHRKSKLQLDDHEAELIEQRREERERLQYLQGVGSVPYGLPCLAVTRRTTTQQFQLREVERVNTKLCQIMRVPADFIDVERSDGNSDDDLSSD